MDEATRERFRGIVESAKFSPSTISSSWPVYREGNIGRPYFNFDFFLRDPGHLLAATHYYIEVIANLRRSRPLDLLAFIEKNQQEDNSTVGAIKLAGAICTDRSIWLPHIDVRLGAAIPHDKVSLPRSTDRRRALAGRKVAIVTDHVSSGDELFGVVEVLRSYEATVTDAVTFSVWMDLFSKEHEQRFKDAQVAFHYICALKELAESEHPDLVFNEALELPEEITETVPAV